MAWGSVADVMTTGLMTVDLYHSGINQDLGYESVDLAEGSRGGWGVSFQRTIHPTETEIAAGLGGYAITTVDGLTHYGGILQIALVETVLVVSLDVPCSRALGTGSELRFRFQALAEAETAFEDIRRVTRVDD